ncbi:hypothetical protein QP224_10915, partial [Actinotignum timonense]|nr:hypothetical protein [Actinotignum timonense]
MKHKIGSTLWFVLTVLTGCAAGGSDSGTAGNADSELAASAASEWDPDSWKTDIEISPKFTSEEEKLAFRKRWLERN